MTLIHIEDLSKHSKTLNRREGLSGDSIHGMGLFALTYWIWAKGVNSYTGTGA